MDILWRTIHLSLNMQIYVIQVFVSRFSLAKRLSCKVKEDKLHWAHLCCETLKFYIHQIESFNGQSMRNQKICFFMELERHPSPYFFSKLVMLSGSITRKLPRSWLVHCLRNLVSSKWGWKEYVSQVCTSPSLTSTRRALVNIQHHQVTLSPCWHKFRSCIRFTLTLCFISQKSILAAVFLSYFPLW